MTGWWHCWFDFSQSARLTERRIVAFDALVVWHDRLQWSEDLQPRVAIEIAAAREERPEVNTTTGCLSFSVLLVYVRKEEKEDARAFTVERARVEAVVLVNRPEIKSALQRVVMRPTEQGPYT